MTDHNQTLFDGFPVSRGSQSTSPHIVLHCQARVLRNLDGRLFPGRAELSDLSSVRGELWRAAQCIKAFDHGWAFEAERTSAADASALEHSGYVDEGWSGKPMAGAMVSAIRDVALVANVDDHLSLNVFRPGHDIREAVRVGEEITQSLAQGVGYSRHAQIGYLTANLSDAGLGLRVATTLHLPVLRMSGRIRSIVRALQALGFAITNSAGSLGKLEDDILKLWLTCGIGDDVDETISKLERETERLRSLELESRDQMLRLASEDLFDRVGRCYGLLCQARKLSVLDTLRFFSGLRLGVDLGMFTSLDHLVIDRLECECTNAQLANELGDEASNRDIEIGRARHVKRTLDLLR